LTLVASRPSHELAGPPVILEWKFGSGSAGLGSSVFICGSCLPIFVVQVGYPARSDLEANGYT
jgi:hypothetical protein